MVLQYSGQRLALHWAELKKVSEQNKKASRFCPVSVSRAGLINKRGKLFRLLSFRFRRK